jgi:hypothetical protein
MGSARSRPLRTESTYHQMQYLISYKPPALLWAGVGVLDRQTYQGGTRGSRLCGEDRDRETENSKVCTRTRDTRFIQARTAKVANPTSCLGDQVWRPALGVGLSPEGLWMSSLVPGPPLYSPGGGFLVGYKAGVLVGLHRASPSRSTGEF